MGGAETVLGSGSEPSWATGNKLGNVSNTGYTIPTVGAGTSTGISIGTLVNGTLRSSSFTYGQGDLCFLDTRSGKK